MGSDLTRIPATSDALDRRDNPPPADFEPTSVGGHVALDFPNSVLALSSKVLDFLNDGAALARWAIGSGVVPDTVATSAQGIAPRQLDRLAAEARALREWFRAVVLRWSVGGERSARAVDLDHLNAPKAAAATRRE